jgi:hypothetical protein
MRNLSEIEGPLQERKAAVDAGVGKTFLALRLCVYEVLNVLFGDRFGQHLAKPRTKVAVDFIFCELKIEAVQPVVCQDTIQELAYSGLSWPFEARHGFGKPQLGFFLVAGEGGFPDLLSALRVRHPPD